MNRVNRVAQLVGFGSFLIVAGCSGQSSPQSNAPNPPNPSAALPQVPPQSFAAPTVPAKSKLPEAPVTATVPVPGLISATKSATIAAKTPPTNQRDPFAALAPSTPVIQLPPGTLKALMPQSAPAKPAAQPQPATPQTRSLPQAPRVALKPMPVPNAIAVPPSTPRALPPISVSAPPAPAPSLTDLAESIEISGVVQVGNRMMAIVKAPDEASARYVQEGAYLAGGQVLLKAIRMGSQGEPTVLLQQNGRVITKSVSGSSNRMASVRNF